MSRAHAEIARLIRRLGRVVDALDGERPDPSEILEVRRLLYGLHAILRLHFAQEEEGYFSLLGDPTGPITESPAPTSPEAPRVEGSKIAERRDVGLFGVGDRNGDAGDRR